MTVNDMKALEASLSQDFRVIEPHLRALDKHLTLRSFLDGYDLSTTDANIWKTLRFNRAAVSFINRGQAENLTRWYRYIEENYPEIQAEAKAKDEAAKAKVVKASKAGANYNLALQDAEKGVVTRFLPEPSGYLHIGHAKAALLSDYFAHQAYNGTLRLRLDDTNPSKEREEFQDAIIEDLGLMGIKPDIVSYTSDHFQWLYEMCVGMIKEGLAYADNTDVETMRKERWDGIASKCRDLTIEENLERFEAMKAGTPEGLKWCIRAKMSVDDPNKAMRDPVVYRCNAEDTHHRSGRTWKIYPTYDLACPLVDSREGVTHALRSTEYTDRNPQYQWFLDSLKLRQVHMWDFSRMNFVRTFLSKRKLQKLVDTGKVWGWDDPRMPTIRGVRRRGMTIAALRDFILKNGPSRNIVTMEWDKFWALNKKNIDPVAPRHTAIAKKDLVTVKMTGMQGSDAFIEDRPKHPKNPAVGTKTVVFSNELIIDQEDAKTFREGEEITLMAWGNVFVRSIEKSTPVTTITCEPNFQGDVKKTEKKVTWLSNKGQKLIPALLYDFDYLLTQDKVDDAEVDKFLNPNTESHEEVLCDEVVATYKKDDIIQLERRGYYRVDQGLDEGGKVVLFYIPTGQQKKMGGR